MPRLVVVGGNAAGMSAAAKARRRREDLEVIVLEAGPSISYSSCGIPHLVGGDLTDPEKLFVLSAEDAAKKGIEVRTGHRVLSFNPYTKIVAYEGPSGRDELPYDKLLLATGTTAVNPLPGPKLEGVFTVRHVGDGAAIEAWIGTSKAKTAAVVGGGFVAVEMTDALLRRGLKVHLFNRSSRLLPAFDAEITAGLDAWLSQQGVQVHLETAVTGLSQGRKTGVVGGVLGGKKEVKADLVVVGAGVKPATEFAVKAGVQSTREGYLHVDDNMHTNFHDVWAAGDCTAPRHLVTGRPTPMATALPSNRMGRVAGDNIAASLDSIPAGSASFPGVLGTAVTRVFGLAFAKAGVSEDEAKEADMDVVSVVVESKTKAPYMPGATDMAVKLTANADNGKVVGCQMAGPEYAVLRINAAAVAIQANLTAKKLGDIETAYSPFFSPVWDPLLVAASELHKKVRK